MDEYGITLDQYASGLEHMWITSYLYCACSNVRISQSFLIESQPLLYLFSLMIPSVSYHERYALKFYLETLPKKSVGWSYTPVRPGVLTNFNKLNLTQRQMDFHPNYLSIVAILDLDICCVRRQLNSPSSKQTDSNKICPLWYSASSPNIPFDWDLRKLFP